MEEILVVKREDLKGYLPRRNLLMGYVDEVLALGFSRGFYRGRDAVEGDASLKQLIPYVILTSHLGIFVYRRLAGGGEKRLHDLVSFGVGGHVRSHHEDPEVNWAMNMARELHEEVHLPMPYTMRPVGILNEDFTEVCTVHLGIVYEAWMDNPEGVIVKEKEELEGSWYPLGALEELKPHMEVWSQILYEHIQEIRHE